MRIILLQLLAPSRQRYLSAELQALIFPEVDHKEATQEAAQSGGDGIEDGEKVITWSIFATVMFTYGLQISFRRLVMSRMQFPQPEPRALSLLCDRSTWHSEMTSGLAPQILIMQTRGMESIHTPVPMTGTQCTGQSTAAGSRAAQEGNGPEAGGAAGKQSGQPGSGASGQGAGGCWRAAALPSCQRRSRGAGHRRLRR